MPDRLIGLVPHPSIVHALSDSEKVPIEQLVIDDEHGLLGQGGCRALMTAVLGSGPGMKDGPYKLLKSLRIWHSNIGDEGVTCIVIYCPSCTSIRVYLSLYMSSIGGGASAGRS